jgi:LysM domain.
MNITDFTNFKYSLKNEMCVYNKLFDGIQESEQGGDFVLPDFLPDIKQILVVRARPKYTGKYISGEKLEYEGEILYNVLYLAEDNTIRGAVFADTYEKTLNIPGIDSNSVIIINPTVTQTSWRLPNPRKINIKIKLFIDLKVLAKNCIEPRINGNHSIEDEINLERNTSDITVMNVFSGESNDVTVNDTLELEGTYPQIQNILQCDAELYIYEAKTMPDKVLYKGDAVICCVYESDVGSYISVSKRIPISQIIDIDGVSDSGDWSCAVNAFAESLRAEIIQNNYGENRNISIDLTYNASVMAIYNDSVSVTRDIYSTEYECTANHVKLDVTSLNRSYNMNFSVNASKSRIECNAENAVNVICNDVALSLTDVTLDKSRSKLILEGNADVTIVSEMNNPETSFAGIQFTTPVKCELDGATIDSNFEYICSASVINNKGRLDTNNVYIDFEVAVNMVILSKSATDVIAAVNLDRDHKLSTEGRPPLTLYYPSQNELLWDIAKRYRTTSQAIMTANNLSDKPTIDSRVLIIPRSRNKSIYSGIL